MAITAVLTGASALVNGLFGTANPKDAERKAQIDTWKREAIAGSAVSFARLECEAGNTDVAQKVADMGYPDIRNDGKPSCSGFATAEARAYAQAAVVEVKARQTAASVAGAVTLGAATVGTAAAPGTYAATVGGGVLDSVADSVGVPPVVVLAGVGVLAYLVLKRLL